MLPQEGHFRSSHPEGALSKSSWLAENGHSLHFALGRLMVSVGTFSPRFSWLNLCHCKGSVTEHKIAKLLTLVKSLLVLSILKEYNGKV